MRRAIATLPSELMRSVTWDQGSEMSNENTNGLLRQNMPKGTDFSQHTPEDLVRIQRSLNGRPRETLGYVMPREKLAELVALTG
jgi:IS30 family transposase